MITKIYEFYKLLTEKAFNIDDTKNHILIRSISKNEVKLCLYNHVNETITGYITADNVSKDSFFTIDRISADKGWGPFMYSLILQSLYPMGVKPSRLIRPVPIKIWKIFLTQPNIITTTLPKSNKNYITKLVPAAGFDDIYTKEDTDIVNTIFYMQPLEWFQPFIIDSEEIIIEKNINTKEIFKECLTFFDNRYYSTTESKSIPNKDISDKYLLVKETTSSIQFIIQDKPGIIFGYSELLKKPDYYQEINTAAESGYGPFLYDTVMSYLDKPVRPNRSLTKEAWNVWNNYFNQRPDVTKTPISDDIWDSVDLQHKLNTKSSIVEPVNYLYSINDEKRKTDAIDWQYKSTQQLVNPMKDISPNWLETRFNQGKKYFNSKYPLGM